MKIKVQWPTAVMFAVTVAAMTTAYLAGPALGVPESSHEKLVAAIGIAGNVVLAFMRGLLAKQAEGEEK